MWSDPSHPANKSKGKCYTVYIEYIIPTQNFFFRNITLSYFTDMGRYAVFCLLTIASEVQDTVLVCTDRSTTDISFPDVVIL